MILGLMIVLSGGATGKENQGVLRQVGSLHCLARLVDDASSADMTTLQCQLRLEGPGMKAQDYEGELVGSGLWLVDPGPVRLLWAVLAPVEAIDKQGLTGDYDIVSSNDFKLAEAKENVLFGGPADSIALELLSPTVDGIGKSTRLTLK